jgi:hypothetical protein
VGRDSLLIFFFPSLVIRTLLVRTLTNVGGSLCYRYYEYVCAQQSKKERPYAQHSPRSCEGGYA